MKIVQFILRYIECVVNLMTNQIGFILTVFFDMKEAPVEDIYEILNKDSSNLSTNDICSLLNHLKYEMSRYTDRDEKLVQRIEQALGITYNEIIERI